MTSQPPLSLAGRTLRFKFMEGPTANTIYEHKFNTDGTVTWRDASGDKKSSTDTESKSKNGAGNDASDAKKPGPTRYASYEVGPGLHLMSYLSEAGYTLTVLVNTNDAKLHGFASSSKEWYPLTGELVEGAWSSRLAIETNPFKSA
jgi:hypothetical protein